MTVRKGYRRNWSAEQKHGTEREYKEGCRCDECRAAINAANRARYAKRKAARTTAEGRGGA